MGSQASGGNSGRPAEISCSTNTAHQRPLARLGSEFQDNIRDFGYSSHGNHNSMSLLRTAELYGCQDTSVAPPSGTNQPPFRNEPDRNYNGLVRQLPSQACIGILVQTFFSNVNWQYDLLDEECFSEDLDTWRKHSYSELQMGSEKFTSRALVFPALLFQVLAQALLFHPPYDEMINSLMTTTDMTFYDLAAEYSDAGAELLSLLGKKNITTAVVQAGLLRASFLKSSGKVVEAWHALGATIRDAQEIGLHTGRIQPKEYSFGPKREGQNVNLVGHKIWIVLHIWDVHMAVVLGRPIATDLQIDRFALTIDDVEMRREFFSHWQTETDLPRPFDIILAGYNVAYRYFKDIHQIEHNGASPQEYTIVEEIHAAINKNSERLPSWCRLVNPDTKFDRLGGCQWLPVAREGLFSLIYFVVLALHRPFIFTVANSRTEALKAGIFILRAQERLFQVSEPHQCKVFNPVYASFDAIVLIAALCLVFPNENLELRAECIYALERGMQRLGIIGQTNSMAKSAHGVVRSLYHRLRYQLDISKPAEDEEFFGDSDFIPPEKSTDTYNWPQSGLSFDAVLPLRPTHDLFYDHLSISQVPVDDIATNLSFNPLTVDLTDGWNFEGTFSDSSFWSLMNDFTH